MFPSWHSSWIDESSHVNDPVTAPFPLLPFYLSLLPVTLACSLSSPSPLNFPKLPRKSAGQFDGMTNRLLERASEHRGDWWRVQLVQPLDWRHRGG